MLSNLKTWVSARTVALILGAGSLALAAGCHHEHHDDGYGYGGGYGGGYGDNAGYREGGGYHDGGGYGDRGGDRGGYYGREHDRGDEHH